jgi:hypothetical protein
MEVLGHVAKVLFLISSLIKNITILAQRQVPMEIQPLLK